MVEPDGGYRPGTGLGTDSRLLDIASDLNIDTYEIRKLMLAIAKSDAKSKKHIRIFSFFESQDNEEKRIEFLKGTYGTGTITVTVDGKDINVSTNPEHGVEISSDLPSPISINWSQAEELVAYAITLRIYPAKSDYQKPMDAEIELKKEAVPDQVSLYSPPALPKEPAALTLEELIDKPVTVKAIGIVNHYVQVVDIEQSEAAVNQFIGGEPAAQSLGITPNSIIVWNKNWLDKELKANIELAEGQVLFGPVLILKIGEDGLPVQPEQEELDWWERYCEGKSTVFTNNQIAQQVRQAYILQGLPIPEDDIFDQLIDRMNGSNLLRVLYFPPDEPPAIKYLDNSDVGLTRLLGEAQLKRVPVEDNIDCVLSESDADSGSTYLVGGQPVYGPFLLARYDESGEYINLTDDDLLRLMEQFSPEQKMLVKADRKAQGDIESAPPVTKVYRPFFHYSSAPEAIDFASGAKARFNDNITALKTLFQVEEEKRPPTPKEQALMAKYAGWGGLSEAFDSTKKAWDREYTLLEELLSPRDYQLARASTTTSFYTPTYLIEAIYDGLISFGYKGGRLLEPGLGTGRFFGAMPPQLQETSKLYGVEPDSLSYRIAKQLYPQATLHNKGLQHTNLRDNSFDIAVGNVPFGDFQLADPAMDKYHFLIHDYFFAKTLEKVRPGGIIAFITSTGTMDKQDNSVRKYLAQRADLVGAIRLPDSTFRSSGTKVNSDIIFLQKRESLLEGELPYWVDTGLHREGLAINRYFIENPSMVLGTMEVVSGPYGPVLTCTATGDIAESLQMAISSLEAHIPVREEAEPEEESILEAPPDAKNYTYQIIDGKLYYNEQGLLYPEQTAGKNTARIISMVRIKQELYKLLEAQASDMQEEGLTELRYKLNAIYDQFVSECGPLNGKDNKRIFRKDVECNMLLALETQNQSGEWVKTDIFSKRTVGKTKIITEVESAQDALILSLNNKGRVDFEYMTGLYTKPIPDIIQELGNAIYLNPEHYDEENISAGWETPEEYLSGNVRKKLALAQAASETSPEFFNRNVSALEAVQPRRIEAGEISVRPGAMWVDKKYLNQFMYNVFHTPVWYRGASQGLIHVEYNPSTTKWSARNGGKDTSLTVHEKMGTTRVSAYALFEDVLNLKDTVVRDKIDDKYYINEKETQLARAKQTIIKEAFSDWIFRDPQRRRELVDKYNEVLNSHVVRKYDGSHLTFPGMVETFQPYPHQKNAIARICDTTHHTILDHTVGAGKTATMILGAHELLRLGLVKRVMFAVPNHIVSQFGQTIYRLIGNPKAMVVTEKDFETKNRKQFLNRIAYSDINMIVVGHSQFERIPMSEEYRIQAQREEVAEILTAIEDLKREGGARFTVKQMEKKAASLEASIERLQNVDKKDSVIPFEQMGIDCLMVDEADMFKNGYIFTKLKNVSGINSASSQRAADMLMKCRYINSTKGKLVLATGTVISNSLGELYIMQRYAQEDDLKRLGIRHFDEWVSMFAETVTSLEPAPEGTGYRQRTRLAKYYNIPELTQLYHTVADVQTQETLKLPVPKIRGGAPEVVICEPSVDLLFWMQEGVKRCADIRNRNVDPTEDNMLKYTIEAKAASLDMRLIDPELDEDSGGKVVRCAANLYQRYIDTTSYKGFQLVFCSLSTPNPTKFHVYGALRQACTRLGIPDNEIAFIHEAKNNAQKEDLFRRCREGSIRILIGSTEKCGAGTNIQDRLSDLHELDCPPRPRDLEQQEGRIIRQGNMHDEVGIWRYVTERSFDAYMWGIVTTKQKFISQFRQGNTGQRFSRTRMKPF